MNHLFKKEHIDFSKEPLFLGSGRNIARLDLDINTHIVKLIEQAKGMIWHSSDYDYSNDAIDFTVASKPRRILFLKNLKFQTVLDSLAARIVSEIFIPITTSPQLESWWTLHAFFENNIHSQTYADIIKALPVDAKAEFDTIMIDDEIISRAESVIESFERTVVLNAAYVLRDNTFYSRNTHMKLIVESLYALNILENIMFKSSFLTTFAFKENGLFDSSASAVSKISMDETLHFSMTVHLLNQLRDDAEWGAVVHSMDDTAVQMYEDARLADYRWIKYLDVESSNLVCLSTGGLTGYVDYNIEQTKKSVRLPHNDTLKNTMKWADKYTKLSNVQTAQKEKNASGYLLGIIDKKDSWKNIEDTA